MQPRLRLCVCLYCSFDGFISSEVVVLSAYADLRKPVSAICSPRNADVSTGIIPLHAFVLSVLSLIRKSKVRQPIVATYPIDMVHTLTGKNTVHPEPCQPVLEVFLAVDSSGKVPCDMWCLDHRAYGATSAYPFYTCEFPCQRVVGKEFFETSLCEHGAPIMWLSEEGRQAVISRSSGCSPSLSVF